MSRRLAVALAVAVIAGGLVGTVTLTAGAATVRNEVDTGVAVAVAPQVAGVGERVTLTWEVTNHGPSTAPAVELVGTIPGVARFVGPATGAGCADDGAGTLTCDIGTVLPGSVVVVGIDVEIVAEPVTGCFQSEATVADVTPIIVVAGDAIEWLEVELPDNPPDDNRAFATVCTPEVAMTIDDIGDGVTGAAVGYRVMVSNLRGLSTTGAVDVTIALPRSAVFAGFTGGCDDVVALDPAATGAGSGGPLVTFPVLGPGQLGCTEFQVTFAADAPGAQVRHVEASLASQPGAGNAGNNVDAEPTVIASPRGDRSVLTVAVFRDANADGVRSPDEGGVARAEVRVSGIPGGTDASGNAEFANLEPGTYVLSVNPDSLAAGLLPTTPEELTVSVGPGESLVVPGGFGVATAEEITR